MGPTIFADWNISQESHAIDDMAAVATYEMRARVSTAEFIFEMLMRWEIG